MSTVVHDVIIIYASVYVGSEKEAHATPVRSSHFSMISWIGYIIALPLLLALILQWINPVDVESKCIIQYWLYLGSSLLCPAL